MSQALGRASWLNSMATCTWATWSVALLLSALAFPTARHLVHSWETNPDYTHGWLLLPATFWLLYRLQPWAIASQPPLMLGAVTMLAGGLMHLSAFIIPWPLIDYLGWVLLLRGAMLAWWGRDAANRAMPMLAFAILLFPLPLICLNQLAMSLQDVIARVAEVVLSIVWVSHRRGQLIYLAGMDEPLSVAVECSGVRQILVFVALAWFLAFYMNGSHWRKIVLVLSAVPLAILANVGRVLALAFIARVAGPNAIHGLLHDVPLVVTLPLGGLLLWLLFQRLQTLATMEVTLTKTITKPRIWSVILTAGSLVSLQLLLQHHLGASAPPQQMARISLDDLPQQLGNWYGSFHPEADRIANQAEFADAALLRSYSNNQGQAAAVYLVYSSNGRDRLHHPEICLRDAGGAVAIPTGECNIPLQVGDVRVAHRFRYHRAQQQQVTVYYWHYTLLPEVTTSQSLLQRIHQRQQNEWPSITVQVQTNMTHPTSWQSLETTLLPELDRWLMKQLPVSTQTGSERLPIRMTMLR